MPRSGLAAKHVPGFIGLMLGRYTDPHLLDIVITLDLPPGVLPQSELENSVVWVTRTGNVRRRSNRCDARPSFR